MADMIFKAYARSSAEIDFHSLFEGCFGCVGCVRIIVQPSLSSAIRCLGFKSLNAHQTSHSEASKKFGFVSVSVTSQPAI